MTFDDFIAHYTGKLVDFDHVYGAQCMDLLHQYIYDVLGLTDATILANPIASQVFTNYSNERGGQYFTKVTNEPNNVPNKGDIIVWGQPMGSYKDTNGNIQYAGHVAIFISGDVNQFTSFDQNFPIGSPCQPTQHTYEAVLGWLSPIPQQPQLTIPQVQDQLQKEAQIADSCQKQLQTANKTIISQQENIQTIAQQQTDLQTAYDKLKTDYENEQKRNIDLHTAVQIVTSPNQDKAVQLLDAQHEVTALKGNLTHIAAEFDIAYQNVKPDDLTNTIITHAKTARAANDQLQKQNNFLKIVKTGASQTFGAIPSSTKQSIWKLLLKPFWTQN